MGRYVRIGRLHHTEVQAARSKSRPTLCGCHCPPREVETPLALSASAIPRSDVTPAAWIDRTTGMMLDANASASRAFAAAPRLAASSKLVRFPSFAPAAFLA